MKNVNRLLGINELHRRGIRGYGVTVAVLDSGVGLHPDLKQRVIGFQDFVHDKKSPYDDLGHGTHVSGIIAGEGLMSGGQYTGVAPQANLVMLKVLNNNGTGNMQQVIDGIRWIIDYGDRYRIRIVNMSFGTKYSSKEEDEILCHAVNELWNLGYIVVASAEALLDKLVQPEITDRSRIQFRCREAVKRSLQSELMTILTAVSSMEFIGKIIPEEEIHGGISISRMS